MGLKQLLIILMLFGTGSSIYSLVNAGIMLTCTFLNMLFNDFLIFCEYNQDIK